MQRQPCAKIAQVVMADMTHDKVFTDMAYIYGDT